MEIDEAWTTGKCSFDMTEYWEWKLGTEKQHKEVSNADTQVNAAGSAPASVSKGQYGSPLKKSVKGGKATMRREIRNEILRMFEAELKEDGASPFGEAYARGVRDLSRKPPH